MVHSICKLAGAPIYNYLIRSVVLIGCDDAELTPLKVSFG